MKQTVAVCHIYFQGGVMSSESSKEKPFPVAIVITDTSTIGNWPHRMEFRGALEVHVLKMPQVHVNVGEGHSHRPYAGLHDICVQLSDGTERTINGCDFSPEQINNLFWEMSILASVEAADLTTLRRELVKEREQCEDQVCIYRWIIAFGVVCAFLICVYGLNV